MDLPVPEQEAAALAELLFRFAEGRPVNDGLRRTLAARAAQAPFLSLRVHWDSLAADPVARSTYFVAADGHRPVLLHVALSTAPGSGLFPAPRLVGRIRLQSGPEVIVNAIPFSCADEAGITAYARSLDRTVLPGPQGTRTLFLAARSDADAAFRQFRAVQAKSGIAVAAWTGPAAAGIWGAIRHGWRSGFPLRGEDGFASRSFVDGSGLAAAECAEEIGAIRRLRGKTHDIDVRIHPPGRLTRAGELQAWLEELREAGQAVQVVEVDIGLCADAAYPITIEEMDGFPDDCVSNVQWKADGDPLTELRLRVEELQRTARAFGAILGITGYGTTTEPVLEAIAAGAGRRLWLNLGRGLAADRIAGLAGVLRG